MPLGVFEFCHVKPELLPGYRIMDLSGRQVKGFATKKMGRAVEIINEMIES